jgi:hypothetical protein
MSCTFELETTAEERDTAFDSATLPSGPLTFVFDRTACE